METLNTNEKHIYISSCCKDGGIYHAVFRPGHGLNIVSKTPIDRPMYTVLEGDRLYVILRSPFEASEESGIVSFDINKNGELYNQTELTSTQGIVACHLCVHEQHVYATNYVSGSVIRLPDLLVHHTGCGVNATRQEGPHTHFVAVTPDQTYICVTDLGTDEIITYDKELKVIVKTDVKAGSGPRHLAFTEDGRYAFCVNELTSTVTMYSYGDGQFIYIDECSTVPDTFKGENTAAAIRISNNHVYVSNRGHDSIAKFMITSNKLIRTDIFSCGGRSPRDFDIIDEFVFCANEKDGSLTVIDQRENNKIVQKIYIEQALCISKK